MEVIKGRALKKNFKLNLSYKFNKRKWASIKSNKQKPKQKIIMFNKEKQKCKRKTKE